MEISIQATAAEKHATLTAIKQLNEIRHIKYMSQKMIADTAFIKATKIRIILMDLIAAKLITQYQVSDNKRLQRYYYVLTDAGQKFLDDYVA